MPWDKKFIEYGVVKVEKDKVKVYKDSSNYTTIYIGKPIKEARWSGDKLSVILMDNKVRVYKDSSNYNTV